MARVLAIVALLPLAAFLYGCGGKDFKHHYKAPADSDMHPVILFVTGFGGDAPFLSYSDFVAGLVAKGYIVAGFDRLAFPAYPKEGEMFEDIMEWVRAGNMQAELAAAGFSVVADLERVAVMGQSAGNHVVGQALKDGCSLAKAFVMIDPVDGLDPFGMIHSENLIVPGEKLPFTIPSLLLDNELDPTSNNFLFPACAPADLGSPRWFDATAGPVWNVNASTFGHIDCINDAYAGIASMICPRTKGADYSAYKAYLADAIDIFLQGVLDGKTDNFALLEDASTFGIDVTVRSDLKGLSHADISSGCTNSGTAKVVV